MTDPTYPRYTASAGEASPDREINPSRNAPEQISARWLMYGLASDLTASPFDAEPLLARKDLRLGELGLPYEVVNFQQMLDEWVEVPRADLARIYSSLFEVGSDGPPVPIREDLHLNQPAGVREDIVRFYEHFGYGLNSSFAWAPDHLSVQLEFMYFLIHFELENAPHGEARPFQLAQIDFAERHLCNWVPELASRIESVAPDSLYFRVLDSVAAFVTGDLKWQKSSLVS